MQAEELKNPGFLKIKFYRISSPLFNYSSLPLSGLYNPILNKESKEYQLNSKFKNFDITSTDFINIENLLGITNFQNEKILTEEKIDCALIFCNNSNKVLTVKEIRISLKSDENKKINLDELLKINENKIEINIPAKESYFLFFNVKLNNASKYQLNIHCHSLSHEYDAMYYKMKQGNVMSECNPTYFIKNNAVEFHEFKRFYLEVIKPFSIKEKFYNYNVNQCLISIKIKSMANTILTITDLYLFPKGKMMNKIEMVKSLDEINNKDNKNENDSKYISLQPKEELVVLFRINDSDLFYEHNEFVLYIIWLKKFDFVQKTFRYEFPNTLNTLNEYYKMTIKEKPESDIILNQNFKIVINLKSKKNNIKYNISLSQEQIQDNDNQSIDREIEIIDIIEKKIELNDEIPSNDFILICKSDILGSVYLPKLRFTLYEGDSSKPKEKVYDSLLSFNCISK